MMIDAITEPIMLNSRCWRLSHFEISMARWRRNFSFWIFQQQLHNSFINFQKKRLKSSFCFAKTMDAFSPTPLNG